MHPVSLPLPRGLRAGDEPRRRRIADRRRVLPRRLWPLCRHGLAAGNRRPRLGTNPRLDPHRGVVRCVRTRHRGSGQRLPFLERPDLRAQELALLHPHRRGVHKGQGQSRLAVRGRGVRDDAARLRRRLRRGDRAALPSVQRRPDRRPEPPLYDPGDDTVADGGAGVGARGLRDRRDRLRAGAAADLVHDRRGGRHRAMLRQARGGRAARRAPRRWSLARTSSC